MHVVVFSFERVVETFKRPHVIVYRSTRSGDPAERFARRWGTAAPLPPLARAACRWGPPIAPEGQCGPAKGPQGTWRESQTRCSKNLGPRACTLATGRPTWPPVRLPGGTEGNGGRLALCRTSTAAWPAALHQCACKGRMRAPARTRHDQQHAAAHTCPAAGVANRPIWPAALHSCRPSSVQPHHQTGWSAQGAYN